MKRFAMTVALALAIAVPEARGQTGLNDVHALNARAHAHALKTAYQRLEQFVLRDSPTAVLGSSGQNTLWTDVPPGSTGWIDDWTERGVRARYCRNASDPPGAPGTLIVYLDSARVMGLGQDHRSVQMAPRMYGGERRGLHWLEGGVAHGGEGRPTIALPACMSALVPSGRAALAGRVSDPWTVTRNRTRWESRPASCPVGMHRPPALDPARPARLERRLLTETVDSRDRVVGESFGPWSIAVDLCVSDYEVQETRNRACTFLVNGQLEQGYEIWTRQKRVTAGGATGTWSMLFSTCSTGTAPPLTPVSGTPESLPAPRIWFVERPECEAARCPSGYTGTAERCRNHRDRYAQFEWDATPTIQRGVSVSNWISDTSGCSPIVVDNDHDGGGDGGGDGGDFGGDGEGEGEGDGGVEGGLGDGEDAAVGGDGLGSETADPSDDGVGSMGGDGGGGDGGDGGC